jgi:hypothetical protein
VPEQARPEEACVLSLPEALEEVYRENLLNSLSHPCHPKMVHAGRRASVATAALVSPSASKISHSGLVAPRVAERVFPDHG